MSESHSVDSIPFETHRPLTRHDELANASIAVLALGPIGDAILTTPLYAGLKRELPGAFLTVIASERNHPIPTHSPDVDHVEIVRSGAVGVLDVLRVVATKRFDLYIDPKDHASTTSRMIADIIRSRNSLLNASNLPFFGSAEVVPPPSGPHFVDSANAPFELLFPEAEPVGRPILALPTDDSSTGRLGTPAGPFVIVNISAGSARRRWEREKWITLIKRMSGNRPGIETIILAAPSHHADAEAIADGGSARFIPTQSIIDAAEIVSRATLVISPDTSIVHLASAFNIPTVALFDGERRNRERFAPLADASRSLHVDGSTSIDVISMEMVSSMVEELMP